MKIVCLGDSITGQPDLSQYLKWSFILECMMDAYKGEGVVEVINRGIGGDTSEGALKRIQGDVLDEKPDIVTVMLGGNDAVQNREDADVRRDLEAIVRKCKGLGAEVLMMQYAVLPNPEDPEGTWVRLNSHNEMIADIAQQEGAGLLDMASAMHSALENQQVSELKSRGDDGSALWESKRISQPYLVNPLDGVHLSPAGELVFARSIFKKLTELGWV